MGTPYALDELNDMPRDAFVAELGGIFEHSPWVAERARESRPFRSAQGLHQAMAKVAYAAGEPERMRRRQV
jgi:2-oxo-4-hydroxy-4-carboxy-5-ureidoimidazoline decarboxylase